MALRAFNLGAFPSKGMDVGEDALLTEGVSAVCKGVGEPQKPFAELTFESIQHLFFSGMDLYLRELTICSLKNCSRSVSGLLSIVNLIQQIAIMIHYYAFMLTFMVIGVAPISLQITGPRTCLALEAETDNETLFINYHHNANKGTAALKVYNTNGSILADSGQGRNYQHNLNITLPNKGLYDMCFEKSTPQNLEVSFQIFKEDEQLSYAGRQDLGRLTRRIGEFLVEIKKASWEYKQILAQHNHRHSKFYHYESDNYFVYGLKLLVMVLVLSAQIWIIQKIFD